MIDYVGKMFTEINKESPLHLSSEADGSESDDENNSVIVVDTNAPTHTTPTIVLSEDIDPPIEITDLTISTDTPPKVQKHNFKKHEDLLGSAIEKKAKLSQSQRPSKKQASHKTSPEISERRSADYKPVAKPYRRLKEDKPEKPEQSSRNGLQRSHTKTEGMKKKDEK
eukprot:TRINITY_DN9362_c0_g1_i1.p1 TRINITY_DN9362_c0_g1~~TRINITY_DN9362_c0_g1_i1.p1  ORF type:complete len:168 (+),score=36.73 TRINITY_DN9362_c0_g1_i1:443-946(+)